MIYQVLGGRSNVFLLSRDDRCILVDTSSKHNWKNLEKKLNALPIFKGKLSALILTHVHYDHVENSARIREKYGVKIIVNEIESGLLESGRNAYLEGAVPVTKFIFHLLHGEKLWGKLKYEPCKFDIVVQNQYDLSGFGCNAYILHTPGHTDGSMSVVVDDEIAIVGDALFGVFRNSVFSPWAANADLMIKSWKILLDTGCKLFLPSHGRPRDRQTLAKQYEKYKSG